MPPARDPLPRTPAADVEARGRRRGTGRGSRRSGAAGGGGGDPPRGWAPDRTGREPPAGRAGSPRQEIDDPAEERRHDVWSTPNTGEQREEAEPANDEVRHEDRPLIPGRVASHHVQEVTGTVVDSRRLPVAR